MKKFIILLSVLSVMIGAVEARDYAQLQIKEMKHAQKYGTTKQYLDNKYVNRTKAVGTIKDPKLIKLCSYDVISKTKYDAKIKSDNAKYSNYKKELSKKSLNRYKNQANGEDYYKVYRVAEKIIRANKLDYLNWRVEIYKDSVSPNAYTTNTNYIAISTALYDTFSDNEDALALIIGHEMGHSLLGHAQRKQKIITMMKHVIDNISYIALKTKYRIESKNMEYAADVEGAKLALYAGYDLEAASDVMRYLSTLPREKEWRSTHPDPVKRLENINENSKYFPSEWAKIGEQNIYNSEVMPVRLSSDRKSMVISSPIVKEDAENYYSPETMQEVYIRFGYMHYINGEFKKSLKNFEELFKIDQSNAPAYLYASYASEYLYENIKDEKYLQLAKEYAQKAYSLDSKNKYIKEQVDSL